MVKTAKKLILEMQKCYPGLFEEKIVGGIKVEEDRNICKAVLRNDEEELNRILSKK